MAQPWTGRNLFIGKREEGRCELSTTCPVDQRANNDYKRVLEEQTGFNLQWDDLRRKGFHRVLLM